MNGRNTEACTLYVIDRRQQFYLYLRCTYTACTTNTPQTQFHTFRPAKAHTRTRVQRQKCGGCTTWSCTNVRWYVALYETNVSTLQHGWHINITVITSCSTPLTYLLKVFTRRSSIQKVHAHTTGTDITPASKCNRRNRQNTKRFAHACLLTNECSGRGVPLAPSPELSPNGIEGA